MKETYIIKIWKTEEERDAGLSEIISSNIADLKTAIQDAKKLKEEQKYDSVEVQNSNQTKSYYYIDNKDEKYIYNNFWGSEEEKITDIVNIYFAEKDLRNLMEYGSDRDYYVMPSFTDLYKGILARLNIPTYNITTEDLSDGKYETTIEFNNQYSIVIDTSAWNSESEVISNVMSIQEEFKKSLELNAENELLETENEEDMEV